MKTENYLDAMLDHALELTFPASDPISIYIAEANAPFDVHESDELIKGENGDV